MGANWRSSVERSRLGSLIGPLARSFRGHRQAVGGLWDVMGKLQLDFLVEQGLQPHHYLVDVGCGSLRGGIHFVRYLEPGHYFGLDISGRLLSAGRSELKRAGLSGRDATLLKDEGFHFGHFDRQFDFAIAQSVFTHLPLNVIMRCVSEMETALLPGGRFFATFFESGDRRLGIEPIPQLDDVVTYCDSDPFYYDPDVFRWVVDGSSLDYEYIGAWGHPRNQKMLLLTRRAN
jgi:SAM-dependent methyltransferase